MIHFRRSSQRGETLVGVLASLAITSLAMAAAVSALMGFSRGAVDERIMKETMVQARSVANMIAGDIRLAGSGMPLSQGNFSMNSASLGTAPLPILTSSGTSSLTFRMNSSGRSTPLTVLFDPASSTALTVIDGSGFAAGDMVYISNAITGGQDGLQATVSSAAGTTINLTSMTYSTSATFAAGSIVEPVIEVTYSNASSGVQRQVGGSAFSLAPSSTVAFRYLDSTGTALTLPLTQTHVATQLGAIEVTVQVTSNKPLQSGIPYTASLTNVVSLRNILMAR